MPDRLLIDTDVLIDFLRARDRAREYIRALTSRPFISAITVGELYAGVRDGPERAQLDQLVAGFRVVPTSERIAIEGGLFARQYRPTHGTGLVDAFIAATASVGGFVLVTLNAKHFPMLANVVVPYVKP